MLFFIEDSLSFNRVTDLERSITRNNITRIHDIVDIDQIRYELKNVKGLTADDYDALYDDLLLFGDNPDLGLQRIKWVLRGEPGVGANPPPTLITILVGATKHIKGKNLAPEDEQRVIRYLNNFVGSGNIIYTGGNRPWP